MPPAESRVKMNGFAAPDTAAVICSAAIKRGFAAPSPGFPAHNFIFSESNLRKILDSTNSRAIKQNMVRSIVFFTKLSLSKMKFCAVKPNEGTAKPHLDASEHVPTAVSRVLRQRRSSK